jgi:hypothetical protein
MQNARKKFPPTHHVSGAIIDVNSDEGPLYIFQQKDEGYPVVGYRGSVCLIGGNWISPADLSPADTMRRELSEEFLGEDGRLRENRELVESMLAGMQPHGEFFVRVPKSVSRTKEFNFDVSVYSATIGQECYRKIKDRFHRNEIPFAEGRCLVLGAGELAKPRVFAFYEKLLHDYFSRMGIRTGIILHNGVYNVRLESDPDMPYSRRDLGSYKINPLKNPAQDGEVFRPFTA